MSKSKELTYHDLELKIKILKRENKNLTKANEEMKEELKKKPRTRTKKVYILNREVEEVKFIGKM